MTENQARPAVDFKELLIANMIEIQALAQLMMEKGIISESEWTNKLKTVQMEYMQRASR